LKLLAMSATFDGEALAGYMNDTLITCQGRQYPVEVRHLKRPEEGRVLDAATATILRALRDETGDILVFLPGEGEIRRVEKMLLATGLPPDIDVNPLYGALPGQRQQAAIAPSKPGRRKVVLATSIAETSLTIQGIRVVIDCGLKRAPKFDPRTGLTRLETLRITKDSATQRAGRAGRLEPGVCFRLWSENEHLGLLENSKPEILEADLAPLALELIRWGASDPGELQWPTPPPPGAYAQALELLKELGAIDKAKLLTRHGREMAQLPTHPRLAHMILKGQELGLGRLACELAALLDDRDILPRDRAAEADIRLRIELLRKRGPASGSAKHIRAVADNWIQKIKASEDKFGLDKTGLLVAHAYPDRIVQRRQTKSPRYKLANGRGAKLGDLDPLGAELYLAAAHGGGSGKDSAIFLAAPISLEEIRSHFSGLIETENSIEWEEDSESVKAVRLEKLGQLVLSEKKLENPAADEIAKALLSGLRNRGLKVLPWSKETENLLGRVEFIAKAAESSSNSESWPDFSEQALTDSLENWLGPYVSGMTRLSQFKGLDLESILKNALSWEQRKTLDKQAPSHFTVPTGSNIRIDYTGDSPALSVRLQEMFGLSQTPTVANGRIPLTLYLLSPAMRPVQITNDIASFWKNSYESVKKDLKGRYPKHYWPDDPLKAEPVRGVRRKNNSG